MSKYLAGVVIAIFALTSLTPLNIKAQTASVETLLNQIKSLQAQIIELQKKQAPLYQEYGQKSAELLRTLRQGDSGDDVKVLQALLAADAEVYPEAIITGFYGPLTTKAVQKFQQKNSLDQVGNVGPKTLLKLKEKLSLTPVAFETTVSADPTNTLTTNTVQVCAKVEPGKMKAKGWTKNNVAIVKDCKYISTSGSTSTPSTSTPPTGNQVTICHIPPGNPAAKHTITVGAPALNAHLGHGDTLGACGTGTTTPPTTDTTPPVISNLSVTTVSSSSTTITWTTNEPATSKVYYGTTSPLNLGSASNVSSTTLVTSHSIGLTSLLATTTYYYVVESKDAANNVATSSQLSFTTP